MVIVRKLIVAILLYLVAIAALAQQPANPPFVTSPWSMLNPDMAGIISTDRSAGASLVVIVPPIPVPTSQLVLRVASAQAGQIDYTHVVEVGDTLASIAKHFCELINADAVQRAANIACQINFPDISTFFGVTHFNDNEMAVTSMTAPTVVQVNNASLAWDAGPVLFLNRGPPGVVPPPGSNCGQIPFNAANSQTPGIASTSYVMLNCYVQKSNADNIAGEFGIYTGETIRGAPLLMPRMIFTSKGVALCDANAYCAQGLGAGTLDIPAPNADGSGPGLMLGGRKVCHDPTTNYLYLAQGSACPPGG